MVKIREILNKNRLSITIALILLVIFNCKGGGHNFMNDSDLNKMITDNYNKMNCTNLCIIDFNDLFDFDWDYVYIIGDDYYPGVTNRYLVSKLIGSKYIGKKK